MACHVIARHHTLFHAYFQQPGKEVLRKSSTGIKGTHFGAMALDKLDKAAYTAGAPIHRVGVLTALTHLIQLVYLSLMSHILLRSFSSFTLSSSQ